MGDARVAFLGEPRADGGGVDHHGPELENREGVAVLADSSLPEEHRSLGIEDDQHGNHQEQRGGDEQRCGRHHDVEDALAHERLSVRWFSTMSRTASITAHTSASLMRG